MPLSPAFIDALDSRAGLSWQMNACYVITAGLFAVPAYKIRRVLVTLTLPVFGAGISAYLAGSIYDGWWHRVNQAASTDADKQWLMDHDGGHLAVGISILFKAFLCFGVISFAIGWGRKRRASKTPDAAPQVV